MLSADPGGSQDFADVRGNRDRAIAARAHTEESELSDAHFTHRSSLAVLIVGSTSAFTSCVRVRTMPSSLDI
jgi:hypothetical protein